MFACKRFLVQGLEDLGLVMRNECRIIVTADDFGKDENASYAIVESLSKGYVSQTSLMVTMPYADRAVELARAKGLDRTIGLHITLTEGFPITDQIKQSATFCAPDGSFLRDGFRNRIFRRYNKFDEEVLAIELEAQIKKFISYGLPLRHCDGHHHAHISYPVFYVLAPLLVKYGFLTVRKPVDAIWECIWHPRLAAWLCNLLRKVFCKGKFSTTSHFGSIELCVKFWRVFCKDSSVEVMTHPRYNDKGDLVDSKGDDGNLMRDAVSFFYEKNLTFCTYGSLLH